MTGITKLWQFLICFNFTWNIVTMQLDGLHDRLMFILQTALWQTFWHIPAIQCNNSASQALAYFSQFVIRRRMLLCNCRIKAKDNPEWICCSGVQCLTSVTSVTSPSLLLYLRSFQDSFNINSREHIWMLCSVQMSASELQHHGYPEKCFISVWSCNFLTQTADLRCNTAWSAVGLMRKNTEVLRLKVKEKEVWQQG